MPFQAHVIQEKVYNPKGGSALRRLRFRLLSIHPLARVTRRLGIEWNFCSEIWAGKKEEQKFGLSCFRAPNAPFRPKHYPRYFVDKFLNHL